MNKYASLGKNRVKGGFSLISIIAKIITGPLILFLASSLFPRLIHYASFSQALITGLIIGAVGYLMELLILKRGTAWTSTLADFAAAAIVIYASQYFFPGAYITLIGAIITALLLGVVEHILHRSLIKTDRTEK